MNPQFLDLDQNSVTNSINVLIGSNDPDGDQLFVSAHTDGAHGTVECTGAGVCTYTPDPRLRGVGQLHLHRQ